MFEETTGTRRLTGNLIEAPSRRFTAGTQGVAGALAAALPPGSLRLDTPVTAIHPNGQDGLDVLAPAGTLHAEHVVLAVPPALALERIDFGDTLPADLVGLARATPVWMGAVAKVVADYPTAFWREGGLAGAALSRTGPLQEVHDMSGPGGDPAALFGVAHARTVRPASSRPSPPSSPGSSTRPPDAPWPCTSRTGRQSIGPPRPPCSTSPTTRSSVPLYRQPLLGGRLHRASTETATEYAGHIEGALAAGERAAQTVLATPGALDALPASYL
ncbi:FAD-dependent oxidoreductase [Streptomyces scabiei]|uniref:FAD-dependent oxidoreductase n=1 Tax=Streptomyces scabiei TaxID=1930 RepID=UPI001FF33BDE|nr:MULTISPECIES: FAD-dependent oxidoreductase [unclassified Streptomyces]